MGISVLYLNPIFEAASNHRYNTGDYLKIDPMLGTNEDFRHLTREAESRGIRIILDGVFSHTGDDSVYFNRYGRYNDVGAYQSKNYVVIKACFQIAETFVEILVFVRRAEHKLPVIDVYKRQAPNRSA